jgi:hypothetical protein
MQEAVVSKAVDVAIANLQATTKIAITAVSGSDV